MNEMKWYEIQSKLKVWVQKIFWTLPPKFVECLNKSLLKFCPFHMDKSKQNEVKGSFMLKKPFFGQITVSFGIIKFWRFQTWQWRKMEKSISQLPTFQSILFMITMKKLNTIQWVENNPTNIHIFPPNFHIFHIMVLCWRLLRMSNTCQLLDWLVSSLPTQSWPKLDMIFKNINLADTYVTAYSIICICKLRS